ncbi:hypothetical protein [Spirillospora sp. NPDC048819]|uniref:effector-associated constant component EACC1 n=1 Tax=Spirillospora sp. NPDC048819 TaxID=3155268 RepID=UPI00340B074D
MDLRISTVDADGQELKSLYRWLSRDGMLMRHAQVSFEQADRPGEMGGVFDLINVLLADASAVAGMGSLAVALKTWRGTRSRPAAITIEHNGVIITLTEGSEEEIRSLLDRLSPPAEGEPGDR